MRLLFVAATAAESAVKLPVAFQSKHPGPALRSYQHQREGIQVDFLITGIGQVSTAFAMTRILEHVKYDLAINIGVAGTFDPARFPVGSLVNVNKDTFSDLGAEDGNLFLPWYDLGLETSGAGFFKDGWLEPVDPALKILNDFPAGKGITVNTVHGDKTSIAHIKERLNPDLETMEGAAFFLTAMSYQLPCIQVRAVSNVVERRNRSAWKMKEALELLNNFAPLLLDEITEKHSSRQQ